MKATTSSVLTLAAILSCTAAAPAAVQSRKTGPTGQWDITGFSASKVHQSSTCDYSFAVTLSPDGANTAYCRDSADSGFSGSTYLANVYNGTCYSDAATTKVRDDVTFTFTDSPKPDGKASLRVHFSDKAGKHVIPADQIVSTTPENPFDTDTSYTGPKEFEITWS